MSDAIKRLIDKADRSTDASVQEAKQVLMNNYSEYSTGGYIEDLYFGIVLLGFALGMIHGTSPLKMSSSELCYTANRILA